VLYFSKAFTGMIIDQGRNRGWGWSPSLRQVKVNKKDEISDSFDLFCVSV